MLAPLLACCKMAKASELKAKAAAMVVKKATKAVAKKAGGDRGSTTTSKCSKLVPKSVRVACRTRTTTRRTSCQRRFG